MPKLSSSRLTLHKKWIGGDRDFSTDKGKIFCKLCTKSYDFKKKFQLEQHKRSAQHQTKQKAPSNERKRQQQLKDLSKPEVSDSDRGLAKDVAAASRCQQQIKDISKPDVSAEADREFAKDVTIAFLKEGIPLDKLEEGPLRDIFDKYCPSIKLPSVSSLRRLVPKLCEENSEETL